MKKYKLTEETKTVEGRTLYRVKALKAFGYTRKGDIGGWVESEKNLSQEGLCWIEGNSCAFGDMVVEGDDLFYNEIR